MPYITGVVLAAFVAYMGGWYLGHIEGNMALLLVVAALVTGLYWLGEKFFFLPRRRAAAQQLREQHAQQQARLAQQGIAADASDIDEACRQRLMQPWWLDWTAGLFPVIAVVLLLRSFAYEPFKIPSPSMLPTLQPGDLILVNKYEWGLRLPLLGSKITQGQPVRRGDVMVFHYPPQPGVDYIKRVVGLPGDTVSYLNKQLSINGQGVPTTPLPDYLDDNARYLMQFNEQLGAQPHRMLQDPAKPSAVLYPNPFPDAKHCNYSIEGVICKVPPGHYFVMGDNRDYSADSRYWGFVPDDHIVGHAVRIWMNFGHWERIGLRID